MTVLETERLLLKQLSYDDCEFIVELVNEPLFKQYIGDKNVSTLDDARRYLREGPIGNYEQHGYGLFLVSTTDSGTPAGICGLIKREEFDDPDIGFAFLKRFRESGYAFESSVAVLEYAFATLGLRRIIAMADPENVRSVTLLARLGFRFEREVRMAADDHDISLFALQK
jgi:RimJ/RimL family protein N-acetyltransferase